MRGDEAAIAEGGEIPSNEEPMPMGDPVPADAAAIDEDETPAEMFQKRKHLSAVPPPDTKRLLCHGHQARAFTAARCCSKV